MLKGGLNAVLKWPFPCRNSALHQRQQRQQRQVRTQDFASGSWCVLQPTNKPVEWWSEEEVLLVNLIYVVWEWPGICETAVNDFHGAEGAQGNRIDKNSSIVSVSNWVPQHNKDRHTNK